MNIGKTLKEAREKKNLTIAKIYEHTRIHPEVLKALEDDDYSKISNPTYVKSFLKGYASYLGIDAGPIIEEYNKLKQIKQKKQKQPEPQQEKTVKAPADLSGITKMAFFILKWLIILVLAVFGGRWAFNTFKVVKAKAVVAMANRKKEMPKKQPAQKKEQKSAAESLNIPKGESLILTMHTTDNVWVKLKVDGNVIFENILKKGASEKWLASENFTIWTGKADALKLNLNGKDIGTAGKGVVKNLIIDREGKH